MDGWKKNVDSQIDGWMNGVKDGLMINGWMDGGKNGWIKRWMDDK